MNDPDQNLDNSINMNSENGENGIENGIENIEKSVQGSNGINGNEVDKLKMDEQLNKIGECVSSSFLDENLMMYIKDSEKILNKIKQKNLSKYNPKQFGIVFEKPLIRLNFDGSFYKGQWSMDTHRNGYGISIKLDGSTYQGTWLNDNINGVGRFTNFNKNYYEGII